MAARGKFPSTFRDVLQSAILTMTNCAGDNDLVVNQPPVKTISLRTNEISFADSAKYLEVVLDKKL